ncbi:MAG: sugar ABC transporter ATP-binding protein [Candidatus Glassbacteria bacterium]|nr:sugar ABC transporter ATP-binding protein [Candidatus Glassbacteria bacterium]
MNGCPILEMERISKSFPGVRALNQVSLKAFPGEVHVLLGENGAGKSTLMKILTGACLGDSGRILVRGRPVEIGTPRQALDLGISMVYQEPSLALHLSVAENIFLGREVLRGRSLGIIDRKALVRETGKILGTLGLSFSPKTPARDLSMAQRQMVEIAKALSAGSSIIILDEPTAALSEQEIKQLFRVIRELKRSGIAFIYISHRLEEIAGIGDRATVLRDGEAVGTVPASTPMDTLIRMMVGRKVEELFPRAEAPKGEELLRVENLGRKKILQGISFSVYAGEILGLAGLVGSGRTELARAVFGADPRDSGRIFVRGRPVQIASPADAIANGIGYLSEDRKLVSLALSMSVRANVTLASLEDYCLGPFLSRQKEYRAVGRFIRELAIKPPHPERKVKFLSGGNQQKVVVARWLATRARVLFFDEPAAGVDVGAKGEIFQLISRMVAQGGAAVLISSYLPELLAVCDRILVMCRGRIARELSRGEATQEEILYYSAVGS